MPILGSYSKQDTVVSWSPSTVVIMVKAPLFYGERK